MLQRNLDSNDQTGDKNCWLLWKIQQNIVENRKGRLLDIVSENAKQRFIEYKLVNRKEAGKCKKRLLIIKKKDVYE